MLGVAELEPWVPAGREGPIAFYRAHFQRRSSTQALAQVTASLTSRLLKHMTSLLPCHSSVTGSIVFDCGHRFKSDSLISRVTRARRSSPLGPPGVPTGQGPCRFSAKRRADIISNNRTERSLPPSCHGSRWIKMLLHLYF